MNTTTATFLSVAYAIAAAVCYAAGVPFSKILLADVPPVFMAAFLYLGAGLGVGAMYLFRFRGETKAERLARADIPYALAMVVLDTLAPIFMMLGVKLGTSASASLLGNFEIVATALIALAFFGEKVSWRLWTAILLITASSAILSFDGTDGPMVSAGSLLVLAATVCWGLENNCTRRISGKSTFQIVTIKGFGSGLASLCTAFAVGQEFLAARCIPPALLLGFVAYGLSIFAYIRAQRTLGAAKTSAYYATAPFIGAILAFAVLGEPVTARFLAALPAMAVGTAFVVFDTLFHRHAHFHTHVIVHVHGGAMHAHRVSHSHEHTHVGLRERHSHRHTQEELSAASGHADVALETTRPPKTR